MVKSAMNGAHNPDVQPPARPRLLPDATVIMTLAATKSRLTRADIVEYMTRQDKVPS
jgi:hypothetical protein